MCCRTQWHCSGWVPAAGQVQLHPVHLQGHLVRVIEAIHRWLPPVLSLYVPQWPSQKPKTTATNVGLGAAQQEIQGTPRPDAASLGFVILWEILGKSAARARTGYKPLEAAWANAQVGRGGFSILWTEWPLLSRLKATQAAPESTGLEQGGLNKGTRYESNLNAYQQMIG